MSPDWKDAVFGIVVGIAIGMAALALAAGAPVRWVRRVLS